MIRIIARANEAPIWLRRRSAGRSPAELRFFRIPKDADKDELQNLQHLDTSTRCDQIASGESLYPKHSQTCIDRQGQVSKETHQSHADIDTAANSKKS